MLGPWEHRSCAVGSGASWSLSSPVRWLPLGAAVIYHDEWPMATALKAGAQAEAPRWGEERAGASK